MAWILADVKKTKLTLKLAEKFAKMTPVPNERNLGKVRMRRLRKKVREHGALPFRWASADVEENGMTYRVNGQHTSAMFAGEPSLVADNMFVTVEQYMCETMSDLADLYSQIDSSESSRTVGDINKSRAAVIPKLADCDKRIINMAVTALSREKWGDNYKHQLKEDRAELLEEAPQFVLFMQEIHDSMPNSDWVILKRVPVAHAMLATWRRNKREAKKFWIAVGRGDGPDAGTADRRLSKYLMRTKIASGLAGSSRNRGIGTVETQDLMYKRCIVAWNAWRRKKSTALRVHQSKMPTAL
jgi:hypothetical protein